jgi:hypothetical protein
MPVDDWQINSTSRRVALRVYAKRPSGISIEACEHGFLLAPEQARQIIRDLSAAVLASDAKRRAELDDDMGQHSHESPEV